MPHEEDLTPDAAGLEEALRHGLYTTVIKRGVQNITISSTSPLASSSTVATDAHPRLIQEKGT